MPELPLASHFNQARQALADMQDQFSLLPPDCQTNLCSELDRFTEYLKHYLDSSGSEVQKEQRTEERVGTQTRQVDAKDREPRLGVVLRRARAGMFVRDLINKTVTWSPELSELLGIDPAEPSQSERFMRMIHPEDYPHVVKATDAAIAQGGTYYQEFRVLRPDGQEIWLSSIG